MKMITPRQLLFAGRSISHPYIFGGRHTRTILNVIAEFGPTPAAVTALRDLGVNPDEHTASVLVRVHSANGHLLLDQDDKPTSYIVAIPCSITQLCVQGIEKGLEVLYIAVGVREWEAPNPAKGIKGDRLMKNGNRIHRPIGLERDTLCIDTDAENRTRARHPKAIALKTTGFQDPESVKPEPEQQANRILKFLERFHHEIFGNKVA